MTGSGARGAIDVAWHGRHGVPRKRTPRRSGEKLLRRGGAVAAVLLILFFALPFSACADRGRADEEREVAAAERAGEETVVA